MIAEPEMRRYAARWGVDLMVVEKRTGTAV